MVGGFAAHPIPSLGRPAMGARFGADQPESRVIVERGHGMKLEMNGRCARRTGRASPRASKLVGDLSKSNTR